MADFIIKKYKHKDENKERLEKTFKKLTERFPEYSHLWEDENARDIFGSFMDYLDSKGLSATLKYMEVLDMMDVASFKINQELLIEYHDLFSENYKVTDTKEQKMKVLKKAERKAKRKETVKNIQKITSSAIVKVKSAFNKFKNLFKR